MGWGLSTKCEAEGCFRRKQLGWQASAVRGEEVRRFREVASMSIVAADGPCFAVDTLTVED